MAYEDGLINFFELIEPFIKLIFKDINSFICFFDIYCNIFYFRMQFAYGSILESFKFFLDLRIFCLIYCLIASYSGACAVVKVGVCLVRALNLLMIRYRASFIFLYSVLLRT